jgi:putative ABC transport system permease protein
VPIQRAGPPPPAVSGRSGPPTTRHALPGLRVGLPFVRAARTFRRNTTAALLSVGTMAVGIGLATAMLAVLNGTLWHPLTFESAERLVAIQGPVSSSTIRDWSAAARSFDALAGYRSKRYTLTGRGEAASLAATVEAGNLFAVLQASAAKGRVLGSEDGRAGTLEVVLSDECWRHAFDADASLLGRAISLNGASFVVVGIMPPGFRFPVNAERVDLYTTTDADLQTDRRPTSGGHPRELMVVARMKAGVAVAQARAEMESLRAADEPDDARRALRRATLVVPLAADLAASVVSPLTALSWAAAGLVMFACVTAAILSLIRVTRRRDEWAIRLAIGATPGDLVRQVLAESVLIAVAGGIAGSVVAALVAGPLLALAGAAVSAAARARFDILVAWWAGVLTVAAAATSGAIPALQAAAVRWAPTAAWSKSPGASGSAARNLLVTVEIALAVVLLASCVSLLRAYAALAGTHPGFDAAGVVTFRIDLSDALYTTRQQAEFFERLRAEAAEIPGVSDAAFTVLPPFGALRLTIRLANPDGAVVGQRPGGAEVHLVSPGYFRAMGIPLIAGREFGAGDAAERTPVIIISRAAAARQFPGLDPSGRALDVRLGPNSDGPLPRVVGVVDDIRNGSLTAPGEPQVYLPYSQAPMRPSTTFVVRLRDAESGVVIAGIRERLRRLDPAVPLVDLKPLADFVWNATSLPRFTVVLTGVFAAAAVFLAMSGLYAVVAYAALCRRREFSIRRALGATEPQIARLVARQCLTVLVPGLVAGVIGSMAVGRGLEATLYGVHPSPAPTLMTTVGVAAALALLATWWPARAAGRDDLRARLQSPD